MASPTALPHQQSPHNNNQTSRTGLVARPGCTGAYSLPCRHCLYHRLRGLYKERSDQHLHEFPGIIYQLLGNPAALLYCRRRRLTLLSTSAARGDT